MTPRRHRGRPATPAAALPPGAREGMVRITVEVPRDVLAVVDLSAEAADRTRAAEIREALRAWARARS